MVARVSPSCVKNAAAAAASSGVMHFESTSAMAVITYIFKKISAFLLSIYEKISVLLLSRIKIYGILYMVIV